MKVIEFDARFVTGKNLRRLMLKSKIQNIQKLMPIDLPAKYRPIPDEEKFRVGFIKEIINIKNNISELRGFNHDELEELLEHLLISL